MDVSTVDRAARAPRPAVVEDLLASIARLDDAALQETMLPAGCYTAPEFFAFEQEEVFTRSWICIGRVEQVPDRGDCLAPTVAGEPVLAVRGEDGAIRALSAVCQHRGEIIPCPEKGAALRCPLHFWTYDFTGRLAGAPRMGSAEDVRRLREKVRLPELRLELWHGFIFVNLDPAAPPLAPSLGQARRRCGRATTPPASSPCRRSRADKPLPWNWKVHVENFTDAYHPEYVHRGTHDFAPSVLDGDGVRFTEMKPGDNAIVRSVPLRHPDGGMMRDGWGEVAMFPPIATLDRRSALAAHLRAAAAQPHPGVRAGRRRLHHAPAGRRRGDLRGQRPRHQRRLAAAAEARSSCPTSPPAARPCARAGRRSGRRTFRSISACRPPSARASCPTASTARSRRR